MSRFIVLICGLLCSQALAAAPAITYNGAVIKTAGACRFALSPAGAVVIRCDGAGETRIAPAGDRRG